MSSTVTQPLFVKNYDALLKGLRITASAESSTQQVEDAILEVRVGLFDELGDSLINSLLSTPFTKTPTTRAELDRAKAALVEMQWVKAILLQRMPSFFADGSETSPEVWNDEGMIRQSYSRTNKEIERLLSSVKSLLDGLKTGNVPARNMQVSVIGPDTKNHSPASHIGDIKFNL